MMARHNPGCMLGGLLLLIFVGVAGWRVGANLSPDAMGMAVGMLFGIMAGIPTALIILASERKHERPHDDTARHMRQLREEIKRLTAANHELINRNRQLTEADAKLLNLHEVRNTGWRVVE